MTLLQTRENRRFALEDFLDETSEDITSLRLKA